MPRKILVSDTSGSFQVVIPDNAKITFGPAIPFPARQEQRMNFQPGDRSYSLRIYVGSKENLYAVFPDVRGFRDLSLEVEAVEDPLEDADIEMSEREQPAPAPRRRASTRPSRSTGAPSNGPATPTSSGIEEPVRSGRALALNLEQEILRSQEMMRSYPGPAPTINPVPPIMTTLTTPPTAPAGYTTTTSGSGDAGSLSSLFFDESPF